MLGVFSILSMVFGSRRVVVYKVSSGDFNAGINYRIRHKSVVSFKCLEVDPNGGRSA